MNNIKKAAFLSYINIILLNIGGLFLTPFIIKSLGDSEYGLYMLIGSLVAYFSLMDFGLSGTVIRYMAKYRIERDKTSAGIFLANVLYSYFFITFLLLSAGIVIFLNLEGIFAGLRPDEISTAKAMFVVLLINLAFSLPGGIFINIANAYEHYTFSKGISIAKYLVRFATIVAVLSLHGKALALVVTDAVINLIFIIISIIYSFQKLEISIAWKSLRLYFIKEIFSYSVWLFLLALVSQFQWQGGQLILGRVADTESIAVYSVGIMLGTYYGTFSAVISSLLLPKATAMVVNNATPKELTDMAVKVGRLNLFILLAILGGFILVGRDFITLWVGENYLPAWEIALMIMGVYTFPLVQAFCNSIIEAKKKVRFKAITYIILIFLGLVAGYFLYSRFGLLGISGGICAGWLISFIMLNVYYAKIIQLDVRKLFINVYPGFLAVFSFSLLICFIMDFFGETSWRNFLLSGGIFLAVYILLSWLFVLRPDEKKLILK